MTKTTMLRLQEHVTSGNLTETSYCTFRALAPKIVCRDGFSASIQASETHYCSPRAMTDFYHSMEIGFPSEVDNLILEYAEDVDNPTGTVYGYVPVEVIVALIEKHGGFAN